MFLSICSGIAIYETCALVQYTIEISKSNKRLNRLSALVENSETYNDLLNVISKDPFHYPSIHKKPKFKLPSLTVHLSK